MVVGIKTSTDSVFEESDIDMIYWVANIFIAASSLLDIYAVYRQNKKTSRCGHSDDVSTAFYGMKLLKDILAIVALTLYSNWAGLVLLIPGFIAYGITYGNVIKHKSDQWKPNKIESAIRRIV